MPEAPRGCGRCDGRRSIARLLPWVAVALLSSACGESVGPELRGDGPSGASSVRRLVLTGVIDENGGGTAPLPPEAGTADDPPATACSVSADGVFWQLPMGPRQSCLLAVDAAGGLVVVLSGFTEGWLYRVEVVYASPAPGVTGRRGNLPAAPLGSGGAS